jgi:Ca-activated chloride channel family protein
MWDFAMPLAFLALPLPLIVRFLLPPRRESAGALHIPETVRMQFAGGEGGGAAATVAVVLPWLLWIALVTALAGPRAIAGAESTPASGREIMLALDLSGSMERRDFEIDGQPASRIEALKKAGAEFIRRRAGDRIGLVIFAEEAYAASPPTYDAAAVSKLLEEATIGLVGRSTAIGDGLALALKRLAASDAPSRVIVLLSDGSNDAGVSEPVQVARLAKTLGIRIHTIAMGLHDVTSSMDDRDAVDSVALQAIAELSGGTAFRVRTTGDLEHASRAIEELEAGHAMAPPRVVYHELWIYPATLAFVCALALAAGGRLNA